MATTTRPARSDLAGRARKAGLALVMGGAMSVSIRGQVLAVEPMLGVGMGAVLAVTNDLAALLALNEIVSSTGRHVRGWAWAVLLLAGGTGASLNTWHAITAGALPVGWAALVGAGPVVLAALLSHLVALALTPVQPAEVTGPAAPVPTRPAAVEAPPAAAHATPATASVTAEDRAGEALADQVPDAGELSPAPQAVPALFEAPAARPLTLLPPLASPLARPSVRSAEAPATVSAEAADEHADRVVQVLAMIRQVETDGQRLSGAEVARRLGCSERTGRRLLNDAKQRHHNNEADPAGSDAPKPAQAVGLPSYGERDQERVGVN
jgi:hypothetical protein